MDNSAEDLEKEVIRILQNKRYDRNSLPQLEKYVECQVEQQLNDSEANLAVLKLYQFYPQTYNASVVSKILIKALTTLPSTDFLCALYLIPERRQVDEPVPIISRLASLLETGWFSQFWSDAGACADLLASVPGSLDLIREFILSVVARTYHTIDLPVLAEIINLNEKDATDLVTSKGWSVKDSIVTCPRSSDNHPTPRAADEQLSFRQVASKILS